MKKIILTLTLITLSALTAFGVLPAPGGGYPNQNTATGEDALFSLTTGFGNVANGFNALRNNTTGYGNTATGSQTLLLNTGVENTAIGWQALINNITGNHASLQHRWQRQHSQRRQCASPQHPRQL
jgi:hypothetical protein